MAVFDCWTLWQALGSWVAVLYSGAVSERLVQVGSCYLYLRPNPMSGIGALILCCVELIEVNLSRPKVKVAPSWLVQW